MQDYFQQLSSTLLSHIKPTEVLLIHFRGETSDFVRINQAKVRHAGQVDQNAVHITFIADHRQITFQLTLAGDLDVDVKQGLLLLNQQRERLPQLPSDPTIAFNSLIKNSIVMQSNTLPPTAEIVKDVLSVTRHQDFVGFINSGAMYTGFASSLGQFNWHEVFVAQLDWSLFDARGQSVKGAHAFFNYEPEHVEQKLRDDMHKLAAMAQAPIVLPPKGYRAFIEPAGLGEVFGLFGSGFSLRSSKSGDSALHELYREQQSLSKQVHIKDHNGDALAPSFNAQGFIRPPTVELVREGVLKELLVSPRSAQEYNCETNGATDSELPENVDMAGGTLARADIPKALGTGVWISNLWYLNFSNKRAGRMTGTTRYATLWVENGKVKGPVERARLDESIYQLLGEQLEDLTPAETVSSSETYGQRSVRSLNLPGALLKNLNITA